jgi:hypothetical protein
MNPYEAIKLNLIKGNIPEPLTFTTTKLAQSWTMRLTTGAVYVFDWGDGTATWTTGNGADQVIAHTYASAGTYSIKFHTNPATAQVQITGASNTLSGAAVSVVPVACDVFNLSTNALTQAAVDAILADFLVNAAARPAVGTINLSGGTNAAPSAAGIASRNAFLFLRPLWTISVNP